MYESFKGILIDIDNTLYDYNPCHQRALESVRKYCNNNLNIPMDIFNKVYYESRQQIKIALKGTAGSHNRLLYFQNLFESLQINPLQHSLIAYSKYWDTFLDEMCFLRGAEDFLERMSGKKICFITDLTAHIQFRKIRKLELEKYTNLLVTSEEAGAEKPDKKIFELALEKMNKKPTEICMIGDSYEKDVLGATSFGIHTFWLNWDDYKIPYNPMITEFKVFNDLKDILK